MSHIAISTPPSSADVAAIQALPNKGLGAVAVHGRANSRPARRRMLRQLEQAGLSHRVAMSLGWSTSMPPRADEPDAADTITDEPVVED